MLHSSHNSVIDYAVLIWNIFVVVIGCCMIYYVQIVISLYSKLLLLHVFVPTQKLVQESGFNNWIPVHNAIIYTLLIHSYIKQAVYSVYICACLCVRVCVRRYKLSIWSNADQMDFGNDTSSGVNDHCAYGGGSCNAAWHVVWTRRMTPQPVLRM